MMGSKARCATHQHSKLSDSSLAFATDIAAQNQTSGGLRIYLCRVPLNRFLPDAHLVSNRTVLVHIQLGFPE